MKILKSLTIFLLFFICVSSLSAQEILFEPHETFIYDVPGTEIIFEIDVTNLTGEEQIVFMVRTQNELPPDWTSALCFDVCFADFVDSVATTPEYGSQPLAPNETRVMSLHVFTNSEIGTSFVQLQAGTFNSPQNRITVDLVATTDPSVDVKEENIPTGYFLSQNYPNPFNPLTKVSYGIKEGGMVSLKIYNILGVEITSIVNEYKAAGTYEETFDASQISSGVYFYSLSVNGYTQTRKMILEK